MTPTPLPACRYLHQRVEVRLRTDGSLVGAGTVVAVTTAAQDTYLPDGWWVPKGAPLRVTVRLDDGRESSLAADDPARQAYLAWPPDRAEATP